MKIHLEILSERYWFSVGGNISPLGAFGNVWRHFELSQVEGAVLLARDAAKHLIMHRKPLHNKELSSPKCQ